MSSKLTFTYFQGFFLKLPTNRESYKCNSTTGTANRSSYFFLDKKPGRCHLTEDHFWQMNGVFSQFFRILLIHIIKEETYE